jgi:HPt (histidine-containing phosphotransfer) domain-containing protein
MKYYLIDPDGKYIKELEEYGKELILEILEMFPDEINHNLTQLEKAIRANNFQSTMSSFHTLRRNLELFCKRSLPEYLLMQNIENQLRELMEKNKIEEKVSLTAIQLTNIEKIQQFSDEVVKEVEAYALEYQKKIAS